MNVTHFLSKHELQLKFTYSWLKTTNTSLLVALENKWDYPSHSKFRFRIVNFWMCLGEPSSKLLRCFSHNGYKQQVVHLFPGSAASLQLSSEMPWASCSCSTWPISKVSLMSGTGWVRVICAASALLRLHKSIQRDDDGGVCGRVQICLFSLDWGSFPNTVSSSLMRVYLASHGFQRVALFAGQLQANAYCDSPDIVLVGTKADLGDLRDVHARQARELADRYGWGSVF